MGGLLRRTMRGSVGVLAVLFCVLCFVVPAKAFAADVPTASYDASTHEATISHAGETAICSQISKGSCLATNATKM